MCVCVWYRPYASPQRSNQIGPSSPSEARSETTAVSDSCRGRWMQTQVHKTRTQIYLSWSSKTECELDLDLASNMHSSMQVLVSVGKKEDEVWLHLEGMAFGDVQIGESGFFPCKPGLCFLCSTRQDAALLMENGELYPPDKNRLLSFCRYDYIEARLHTALPDNISAEPTRCCVGVKWNSDGWILFCWNNCDKDLRRYKTINGYVLEANRLFNCSCGH